MARTGGSAAMNVNVPSGAMCWGRESTFKHTRTPWPERERERTRDRRERGRDVRVTTWCWCDMVLCPQNPSHLCPSSGSVAALSFPVSGPPCIGSSLPPSLPSSLSFCPCCSLSHSLLGILAHLPCPLIHASLFPSAMQAVHKRRESAIMREARESSEVRQALADARRSRGTAAAKTKKPAVVQA